MKLCLFVRNVSSEKNKILCATSFMKNIYLRKSTNINSSSSSNTSSSGSSSSDSDSDCDPSKSKILDQKGSNEALNKLNALLQKIVQEEVVKSGTTIDLAKPRNKRVKKEPDSEPHKIDSMEKQVVNAVKDVAKEIGGDIKQTESELLLKLLNPVTSTEVSATNLSDIVKGMKIDRESKPLEKSRSDQVRSLLQKVGTVSKQVKSIQSERKPKRPSQQKLSPGVVLQKINLFGSEPLGIFTNKDLQESPENKTWQSLYNRDLKLAITHPPANYFQQMILWTEQGKLWKFPIDNEQGLEEEKKVYFTEHVFLDEHLESWCPPKGPVRHFMELVCVGLSKNSYLTVEAKKEHIEWYRNYFQDKKKILQDVGALPA